MDARILLENGMDFVAPKKKELLLLLLWLVRGWLVDEQKWDFFMIAQFLRLQNATTFFKGKKQDVSHVALSTLPKRPKHFKVQCAQRTLMESFWPGCSSGNLPSSAFEEKNSAGRGVRIFGLLFAGKRLCFALVPWKKDEKGLDSWFFTKPYDGGFSIMLGFSGSCHKTSQWWTNLSCFDC